jgi:thiamine phosphate synthase YjbQ (UPF0047 family)
LNINELESTLRHVLVPFIAALTNVQISIPVLTGDMVLGTWQGIYVFEHRARPHDREVVMHLSGT